MKKVLFVCLGNICRSPLGEAIFNHQSRSFDMSSDSAGTAAYHIGKNPDPRSIRVAQSRGVAINHKARKFTAHDFHDFDFVIAMDQQNYTDMASLAYGETKNLFLLRSFDPLANGDLDVPDPYYGGDEGFEAVFEMIDRSVVELIKHIQKEP